MKKFIEIVKKIFNAIWTCIKFICSNFFKIFNTKEKLAAIILTVYTWYALPLKLNLKLEVFALFFILGVLLLNIKESK